METISKDLTHVNVYFTDTTVTEIKVSPLNHPFGLVSNIGGLMGVFVGMSLLSFCEILQLIFSLVKNLLFYFCKKAENGHKEVGIDREVRS